LMDGLTDRIELGVSIHAEAGQVWRLVSEPDWFINQAAAAPPVITRVDAGRWVVRDERFGPFVIRTVGLRAPRYAAFRWEPVVRNGDTNAGWTLIEFWIEDQGDALVSLRVRESGFSWAGLTDEQRRDVLEGNAEGWEAALEAARSFLEHS
jgi:hypothetical protein